MSVSARKWLVDWGYVILGFGFQEWVLGMSVRVSTFCLLFRRASLSSIFVPVLVENLFVRLLVLYFRESVCYSVSGLLSVFFPVLVSVHVSVFLTVF